MDTLIYYIHCVGLFFTFLNPFVFFVSTIIWISLYTRTRKELDRAYLRCYALEKQVDFLVGQSHPDREFFDYMKKTYKDLEERR